MTENIQSKILASAKAKADTLFYLGFLLLSAIIKPFIHVDFCTDAFNGGGSDATDIFVSCGEENEFYLVALCWLCLSALRVFFLASRWQAGPCLHFEGLMIKRDSGKPVTLPYALKYVLIEWLPSHICALYFLTPNIRMDLTFLNNLAIIAVGAQTFWLTSIVKYKNRNAVEYFSNSYVEFLPSKLKELEKKLAKKRWWTSWGIQYSKIYSMIFLLIFAFLIVQIIRTPSINPGYREALYANKQPVWENNGAFAVAGIFAPREIKDTYKYGLQKSLEAQRLQEKAKAIMRTGYSYPVPENLDTGLKVEPARELKINDSKWKDLACLYSMGEKGNKPCATPSDLNTYIQQNRLLWDRFNALPEFTFYNRPPYVYGFAGSSWLRLSEMKAANIILQEKAGHVDLAFSQWLKYTKLYRVMAASKDNSVSKAIMMVVLGHNSIESLQTLLFLHPELAVKHKQEIQQSLFYSEGGLFNERTMLADDLGALEPLMPALGNVAAINNMTFDCIHNYQLRTAMPVLEYYSENKKPLCDLAKPRDTKQQVFFYSLQPGSIFSNLVDGISIGGVLKGAELAGNAKMNEVKFRMVSIGVDILAQKIPAKNVPAYLAQLPQNSYNPLTQKPFDWDADKKELYFFRLNSDLTPGRKEEFRLNLKE